MNILKKMNKKPEKKKLGKKGDSLEEKVENSGKEKPKKLKKKEKVVVKKEKDDTYIMKKNTGMLIGRWIFWIMLISVFLRGFYEIIKPTKITEVESVINEFKNEQKSIGDTPEEALKFAQDFVKEYLTYQVSGESEFKERIKPYVSNRIYNTSGIYSFRNSAKAIYVNAYKKENYTEEQYDVYVNAEVEYQKADPETGEIEKVYEECTVKVPVKASAGHYCIESLPMYVEDSNRQDKAYNPPESSFGLSINSQEVTPAVTNFLDAYYSQDQSMINYLLTPDADKSKFIGLNKRYVFQSLENITAYLPEGETEILCIVKAKIQDAINEEIVYQEYNVRMVQDGDKYYIKDIDSRVTGVK